MKKRRYIQIFLLMVMSLQVLPVAQVGYLLYQNMIQEEIVETCEQGKVKRNSLDEWYKMIGATPGFTSTLPDFLCNAQQDFAERIPVGFVNEVQTPPPNPSAC